MGSPRLRGSMFFRAATSQPFLFPSFHKVMLYVYFVAYVDSPYTPERPHMRSCLGRRVETSIESTSNPLLTLEALVMGIQQGHNERHGYSTMKFDPLKVGGTDGSRLPGRAFIPIPGSRENRVLFKAFDQQVGRETARERQWSGVAQCETFCALISGCAGCASWTGTIRIWHLRYAEIQTYRSNEPHLFQT